MAIKLFGVLYAGPQHIAVGDIAVVDSQLESKPVSLVRMPNNPGYVVKAYKIFDMRPVLERLQEHVRDVLRGEAPHRASSC